MADTLDAISSALDQAAAKKSNLREAFDDLQALSSSLSSFDLAWFDIDSHFTSIQTHLRRRFDDLKSQLQSLGHTTDQTLTLTHLSGDGGGDLPRPELQALCQTMNGLGLRRFLLEHPKERQAIRREIPRALACAPDPPGLVLAAMDGFYTPDLKGDKDPGVGVLRRTCIVLLEELLDLKAKVLPPVKARAGKLAMEWKGKMSTGAENPLEALGFLHLLAAFGLGSEFPVDDVLDLFVVISQVRQAVKLCRALIPEKVPNLIQKLIGEGKQLLAAKFTLEFHMTDKFPPVPLLKAYVLEAKKIAQKVRKQGNNSLQSQNEATAKETSALRQVIKYIENHNLESEYPKVEIEKRVEQLEKQKADRKRPAAAGSNKQPNGSKRPWLIIPKNMAAVNSTIPSFSQSHLQSTGLLQDRAAPLVTSSSAGPYSLAGSAPPPAVPAADPYAMAPRLAGGTPVGFPGNLSPTRSHLYSSGSASQYKRPVTYVPYDVPTPYLQSYYPQ